MKKLLGIILISILSLSSVLADESCTKDIEFKFTVQKVGKESLIPDYRNIYMHNSIGFWFRTATSP